MKQWILMDESKGNLRWLKYKDQYMAFSSREAIAFPCQKAAGGGILSAFSFP